MIRLVSSVLSVLVLTVLVGTRESSAQSVAGPLAALQTPAPAMPPGGGMDY